LWDVSFCIRAGVFETYLRDVQKSNRQEITSIERIPHQGQQSPNICYHLVFHHRSLDGDSTLHMVHIQCVITEMQNGC